MGVWSQVILLSVRETELEEMNSHEREQNQNPIPKTASGLTFASNPQRCATKRATTRTLRRCLPGSSILLPAQVSGPPAS